MARMPAVFRAANHIQVEEVDRPPAGPGEALLRITLTTICGTDFPAICLLVSVIPLLGGESVRVKRKPAYFHLPPNTCDSVLRSRPHVPVGGAGTALEVASLASRVAS